MDIVSKIFITEFGLILAEITHGGLSGFFHHVAEGAGELNGGLVGEWFGERGFDADDVAAVFAVDQAGGDADFVLFAFEAVAKFGTAEEFVEIFGGCVDCGGPIFGDLAGGFSADRANFAIEGADSGFACVFTNDVFKGFGIHL